MAWPATFLHGQGAATGVALINSVANMGGMVGPYLIGALREAQGSYTGAFLVLAGVLLLTSIMAYCFPDVRRGASDRELGMASKDVE